ncbi:hypothetical protein [Actinomadura sp. 6N118]
MLTGVLPFVGENPRELGNMHRTDTPLTDAEHFRRSARLRATVPRHD